MTCMLLRSICGLLLLNLFTCSSLAAGQLHVEGATREKKAQQLVPTVEYFVVGKASRRKLQQATVVNEVVVRNETELLAALDNYVDGLTILLDLEERNLILSETLVLKQGTIVIRGNVNQTQMPPVLTCPEDGKSAVRIKGVNATIESVDFTDCNGAAAVQVEMSDDKQERLDVRLRDIHFWNNGQKGPPINGSALRVRDCEQHRCQKTHIRLRRCTFENNRGNFGGAVYVHHAYLSVRKCWFVQNVAESFGGALCYKSHNESLRIAKSTFMGNRAIGEQLESSMLPLRFEAIAGVGGAVFSQTPRRMSVWNSHFLNNTGEAGGGAMEIRDTDLEKTADDFSEVTIQGCRFENNSALPPTGKELDEMDFLNRNFYVGGAVAFATSGYRRTKWSIRSCDFIKNKARHGGALFLMGGKDMPVNISNSVFEQNQVSVAGGAILVRNASLSMTSTNVRQNEALYGGGMAVIGFAFLNTTADRSEDGTIIEGNTAMNGGGIFFAASDSSELKDLTIKGNRAFRFGGGIHAIGATTFNPIAIAGIRIENNTAMVGGGISLYAIFLLQFDAHRGQKTVIAGNAATVGGGLYYNAVHLLSINITIAHATFERNKAFCLRNKAMQDLKRDGETYTTIGAPSTMTPYQFASVFETETVTDLLSAVPGGQGGGLTMTFANLQVLSIAEVKFSHVDITKNEALVGGGASIHFAEMYWNKGNRNSCYPIMFGVELCQRFYLSNVRIKANRAEYAGGIFTTHPDSILLTCDVDHPVANLTLETMHSNRMSATAGERSRTESENGCFLLEGNEAMNTKGQYEEGNAANAGTSAKKLTIHGLTNGTLDRRVASGEILSIPYDQDAEGIANCNGLVVLVKDAFDQNITRGIDDANLTLSVNATNTTGEKRYAASEGKVCVDNLQAHGVGVPASKVDFQSEKDPRISVTLQFSTRECYPGERQKEDGCQPCTSDKYSFDPELEECILCPSNAVCSGSATLVPKNGFWHSNPFSPVMKKCLVPEACTYDGREEELKSFYTDDREQLKSKLSKLQNYISNTRDDGAELEDFSHSDAYPQCNEGYEGILCGSCERDYGRGFSGNCERCPNAKTKVRLLLFAAILVTIMVIGANCTVTLLSTKARIELVRYEQRSQASRQPVLHRMHQHIIETQTVRTLARHNTVSGSSVVSDEQNRRILSQQLVATVQLTETLKVLVNYLQITSAAARLPVDWATALEGLLSFQAGFVGVTSEAFAIPFECNFGNGWGWPPSILAIWMRVLVPCIALWCLALVYTAVWATSRFKAPNGNGERGSRRPPTQRLITGIIVIFIVAVYFSYIDNVREFMRSVNCIHVDNHSGNFTENPFLKYAMLSGKRVWVEDTDLECFKGKHRATGLVGGCGLFVAALVILFIIFWHRLNRRHITKTEFVARYWFIYQAYKPEWYTIAWEAAILARKAIIAAVVVFSYHLGPSLQALICVGTLMVAYVLQTTFQPFKIHEEHDNVPDYAGEMFTKLRLTKLTEKWVRLNNSLSLNALESASLVSSALVFYTASIIVDPQSSNLSDSFLSYFAFLFNLSFFVFMLYRIYCGMHVLLDLKLEHVDPNFMAAQQHENSLNFKHFLNKGAHLFRAMLKLRLEGERAQTEAERSSDLTEQQASLELAQPDIEQGTSRN